MNYASGHVRPGDYAGRLRETAKPYHDGLHGWDGMAIELEYAEMLYTLVRALRPKVIMETGAGRGIATTFLAQGCIDNDGGWVYTFEPDEHYADRARAALDGMPATVLGYAWSPEHVLSLKPGCPSPSLVFIDSGAEHRYAEVEWWLATGRQDITVVVHDANRPEYGLDLAEGVLLPRGDGLWIGHA